MAMSGRAESGCIPRASRCPFWVSLVKTCLFSLVKQNMDGTGFDGFYSLCRHPSVALHSVREEHEQPTKLVGVRDLQFAERDPRPSPGPNTTVHLEMPNAIGRRAVNFIFFGVSAQSVLLSTCVGCGNAFRFSQPKEETENRRHNQSLTVPSSHFNPSGAVVSVAQIRT